MLELTAFGLGQVLLALALAGQWQRGGQLQLPLAGAFSAIETVGLMAEGQRRRAGQPALGGLQLSTQGLQALGKGCGLRQVAPGLLQGLAQALGLSQRCCQAEPGGQRAGAPIQGGRHNKLQ
ncbi:hypothetical protein D3C84_1006810 [compost metagenome]